MSYGDENDLHEVAGALREVATAILKLGNGSIPATSPIGAVEGLAMKIDDGAEAAKKYFNLSTAEMDPGGPGVLR
jgi:hypothetical protein